MKLLDNQICVVTGAGSGIGEATAKLFVEQGATVVLADFNAAAAARVASESAAPERTYCVTADLTKAEELISVFEKTIAKYGRIDVLVCNAGILDYHAYIMKLTRELWDYTVNINQTAVFRCCREALKYMAPAGKGNIVIVSSIAGVAGNSGMAYTASKYGVIGICKNVAIEYAGKGIRCNAICPGETDTPLNHPTEKWIETSKIYADDDFCEKCFSHNRKDVPWCTAQQQANVILFLASDMSSGVTGQYIQVDNGLYIAP